MHGSGAVGVIDGDLVIGTCPVIILARLIGHQSVITDQLPLYRQLRIHHQPNFLKCPSARRLPHG